MIRSLYCNEQQMTLKLIVKSAALRHKYPRNETTPCYLKLESQTADVNVKTTNKLHLRTLLPS